MLLSGEGTVKILDMGLARIDSSGDAADHQLTGTGTVMGTVDYMSPEQATNTHNADARSDIYSLGCSLYRLLTGENAFGGTTVVEKILAHMGNPIPSLPGKRPDCPAEIDRIFRKMLAKRPEDRYQQAAQLAFELEAWRNPGATAALSSSSITSTDAELNDFLRNVGGTKSASASPGASSSAVKSATKHSATGVPEQTAAYAGVEIPTHPKSEVLASHITSALPTAAKPKAGGNRSKKPPPNKLLIGAAAAGAAVLLVWGIIVQLKDDKGNVIAEANVPVAVSVEAVTTPTQTTTPKVPVTSASGSPMTAALSLARLLTSPDYEWTVPENLGPSINGPGEETDPSLTGDELRLFYHREDSTLENYEAVRLTKSEPFGKSKPAFVGRNPYLSMDGLTLMFIAGVVEQRNDIKLRRRATLNAPWGAVELCPEVNSALDERQPTLSPDGKLLYFARAADNATADLWVSSRASPAQPFGPAANVGPVINTAEAETRILPLADGRTLIFRRMNQWYYTVADAAGLKSALPLRENPFGMAENIWFAPDARAVYFAADLPGGFGGKDIWVTRRVPKAGKGRRRRLTRECSIKAHPRRGSHVRAAIAIY